MQLDLSMNYFELFGLAPQFSIDDASLMRKFQDLQKHFHPDRFASRPEAERRWSMQAASFVNEGYQTLGNDLRRASYLLELNGIAIDEETDTHMAPQFLMEQMEYREALESVQSSDNPDVVLDGIRRQLRNSANEQVLAFNSAAESRDWSLARTIVRQWQFIDKLTREVKSIEERLDA